MSKNNIPLPLSLKQDAQDIEENGIIRNPATGEAISRIGMMLSFFFMDGWSRQKREGMLQIAKDYVELFPDKITHVQYGGNRRYNKFKPEYFDKITKVIDDNKDDEGLYIYMRDYDGKSAVAPAAYYIIGFGESKDDSVIGIRPVSSLKLYFPASFALNTPQAFIDLVRKWCNLLSPSHGTAGLAVLSEDGNEENSNYVNVSLLQHYPALDFNPVGIFLFESSEGGYDRPRSSNWLTILGQNNVDLLGGKDKLKQQIDSDMSLIDFNEGVIVRAGENPVLGNDENGGIPQSYKTIAKIIKPIAFQNYKWGLFRGIRPVELNRVQLTPQWFNRFDE